MERDGVKDKLLAHCKQASGVRDNASQRANHGPSHVEVGLKTAGTLVRALEGDGRHWQQRTNLYTSGASLRLPMFSVPAGQAHPGVAFYAAPRACGCRPCTTTGSVSAALCDNCDAGR